MEFKKLFIICGGLSQQVLFFQGDHREVWCLRREWYEEARSTRSVEGAWENHKLSQAVGKGS